MTIMRFDWRKYMVAPTSTVRRRLRWDSRRRLVLSETPRAVNGRVEYLSAPCADVIACGSVHRVAYLKSEEFFTNANALAAQTGEDHPTVVEMRAYAVAYAAWSVYLATNDPPI